MQEKNRLFNPSVVNHNEVIEKLVLESSPRKVFLMLIVVASVIASLGLLNDSPAVVIGAMLVAPLLWPVLGISMGILVRDWKMIKLAFVSICFATALAIATAMIITFFYVPLGSTHSLLEYAKIGFMIPVSIAAGAAAAFAVSYENVKEAVSGVAITVALLPPVVSIGIGLGAMDWTLMLDSAQLFLVNLLGIICTAFIVFMALGFYKFKNAVEVAVKKEERVLKNS